MSAFDTQTSTAASRKHPSFLDGIDRHSWGELGAECYLRDYMLRLKPVVILDALEHWPARTTWTLDFFRDQLGDLPLEINGRRLSMAELISEVEVSTPTRPAPYLHNYLVSRLPENLWNDIAPMPECTGPNWLEHPWISSRWPLTFVELYIGGTGASFPILHYDGLHTHAFLMQLQGVKEYLAFSPDQTPLLYPKSEAEGANRSHVDNIEEPDLERFPRTVEAVGIRFQLHPGETLFIPSGWWHTANILTPSITISINGANQANWTRFCNDFCREYTADRTVKGLFVAAYLRLFGLYMRLWR